MDTYSDSIANILPIDIFVIGILAVLATAIPFSREIHRWVTHYWNQTKSDSEAINWMTLLRLLRDSTAAAIAVSAVIWVCGALVIAFSDRFVDLAPFFDKDNEIKVRVFKEFCEAPSLACAEPIPSACKIQECPDKKKVKKKVLAVYSALKDFLWIHRNSKDELDDRDYLLYSQVIINLSRSIFFLAGWTLVLCLIRIGAAKLSRKPLPYSPAWLISLGLATVGVGVVSLIVWMDKEEDFDWKVFTRYTTVKLTAGADERAAVEQAGLALCGIGPQPSTVFIIDAGSSGSRLYGFEVYPATPYPEITPLARNIEGCSKTRIEPGLHKFKDKHKSVADYLNPLLDCASEHGKPSSTVNLLATAGMRDLREEDPEEAAQILRDARSALKAAKLDTGRVGIITGNEEARFAWLTANYATGRLGSTELDTLGILELGGSSAQIAYMADVSHAINTGRSTPRTDQLLAHSAPACGRDRVQDLVAEETACYPKNYRIDATGTVGTGDFYACQVAIRRTLTGAKGCSLADVGRVKIDQPAGDFVAIAAYFHTAATILDSGSDPLVASITNLSQAGEEFCSAEWADIKAQHMKTPEKYLSRNCFNAAYIALLLQEYGFDADDELRFEDDYTPAGSCLPAFDTSWTLGAALESFRE